MLGGLATFIARRARRILVVAAVFVAVAGLFGGPVVGLLDAEDDFDDPAAEAIRAHDALLEATGAEPAPDIVALVRLGARVDTPTARAKLERVEEILRAAPAVAYVNVPDPESGTGISGDSRSAVLSAGFEAGAPRADAALALQAELERVPGVVVGGAVVAQEQVGEQVSEDLARAEMLAFPILFVLSLFVFRSVVAALLPLAVGMTSILVTFALMRVINEIEPMSVFAINLITGLGLGLSIDYSLFMVSRFREELERGSSTPDALRATMRSAGRTVLFSALTVAAALAALIVFRQRFLFSMGIGGALVAITAAVVSLTLLPALLAALGPRVNALSPRRWQVALHRDAAQERAGFWYRLSQAVMRRPGTIAGTTALLLILAGVPFLRIEFTGVDAGVLPAERSARVVSDALARDFPGSGRTSLYLALDAGREDAAAVAEYAERLRELPGATAVTPEPEPRGDSWRIDVVGDAGLLDERSRALVRDVRAVEAPFDVLVGGFTANFVDQQASLAAHLPVALLLLCATTLVLLFLMTGSVVLPVKTLLMNLLTVSAAFGVLVLVFQDGRFEDLLGYTSQGALESSQPILLFAVAFGLSTDYGVFLLTRIKEARDAGLPDDEAVGVGLERTGRIITFAALLFCIAIGAFATSEVIFVKQVGVGTALAVLIDATLVRALLVPSLMALLGRWNWWAPAPLARLHARIGLEEAGAGAGART